MAHLRRGRMGLANRENLVVPGQAGKGIAVGTKANVDLSRNVVGGAIAKKMVTRAALKPGINFCTFKPLF